MIKVFSLLFILSMISLFTRTKTIINVNYITIITLLELINSYAEEALNLLNNKKYVVELVFKNISRVSSISREEISFITPLKIIYAIYLIYKSYNPLDD